MTSTALPAARLGLAGWVAGLLATTVLTAVLVLLVLVERFARVHAIHTANTALAQIGWQMRDQLDRGMAYRYEELRVLSGLSDLQPAAPPDAMRQVLERVQDSFPRYAWIGYADRDGRVIAATGDLLRGQDVAKRPWFQGGSQGAFVGDVHPAVLLERLLPAQDGPWRFVDIAMPMRHADGRFAGVLGAHLSWQWARDLQRDLLAPSAQHYAAELFVVDPKGQVLLGPPGSEGQALPLAAPAGLRTLNGAAMRAWSDGHDYVTAVVPTIGHRNYPGLGWIVVVRQPERVALAGYHALQREMLIGGVAVCLLAALLSPWLARRLTRPLRQLTEALHARARDPAAPMPVLDSYHEVALLSRALAAAAAQAGQHRAELQQINSGLEQRVAQRTAEIEAGRLHLRTITDNMPALVADVDRTLRFRFANRTYQDWFGVAPADLIGSTLESLYGEAMVRSWQPDLARVLQGQRVDIERSQVLHGRPHHSHATYLPHRDAQGRVDGFHALVFDITATKELEQRLEREATRDALTGLPNRRHLLRYMPQALARADRQGHHLALLFLDLNGFKAVNDTHGHEAGDELLREVGQRLLAAVRQTDTVARLAGDEFVVLLEPVTDPQDDPGRVATKIGAVLAKPIALQGGTVRVGASIGSAVYTSGCGRTAEELLASADGAMYAIKRGGLPH